MLRVVPPTISDERVDAKHARGREGRRPKVKVCKLDSDCFSAVTIKARTDRGHLQYACEDDCFGKLTLSDIQGISFPGAYGRRPFRDLWSAWKTASIFVRTDISVPQKIQYVKEGVVVLDAAALCEILRLAYNTCTDWTEFLCATRRIAAHPAIEENSITEFYRVAFEKLKQDLKEESQAARKVKQGPIGFAGPETAWLLEKDGPRGSLITKAVTTYAGLRDALAG
ncbi:unnamed protein product [Heligmosomoides polygyrus]|uniref:DDT domain-containing protein n=1 Tax=Heligmosomoides polygyrus TaxID=6339 RepID=A0A183F773_HELPZ|nr:unnamed protein product [Heligmosomoides polygyrus]